MKPARSPKAPQTAPPIQAAGQARPDRGAPFGLPPERVLRPIAVFWLLYTVLLAGLDRFYLGVRPWTQPLSPLYYGVQIGLAAALLSLSALPRLRARLGDRLMPVAICVLAILPLFATILEAPRQPFSPITGTQGFLGVRLLPLQMLGVALIAAYYRWRHVVIYSLSIAALLTPWMIWNGSRVGTGMAVTIAQTIMLLVCGGCGCIIMRHVRAQHAALTDAHRQLRHYAGTLEELTIGRERARIARELHDNLAATLTGATIQLEVLAGDVEEAAPGGHPAALSQIRAVQGDLRAGLAEMRRSVAALRAGPLALGGLAAALAMLAKAAAAPGREVALRIDGQLGELPEAAEQALYRIAQEALTNAVRHADASRIAIVVTAEPARITLSVRDDGRGFAPEAPPAPGHFGLPGMRERALVCGAEMRIDSRPGAGTTVTLALPLD